MFQDAWWWWWRWWCSQRTIGGECSGNCEETALRHASASAEVLIRMGGVGGGLCHQLFLNQESILIERCPSTFRMDRGVGTRVKGVFGTLRSGRQSGDWGRLMMTEEKGGVVMGRGRDGRGGVTERTSQRESQYSFDPYLWWRRQRRLRRGNITTGCALYWVSSGEGKGQILKLT